MIPEYCDRTAEHPANKWGVPETRKSLLDHWPLFTLEHIVDFHCDTMYYCEAGTVRIDLVR